MLSKHFFIITAEHTNTYIVITYMWTYNSQ